MTKNMKQLNCETKQAKRWARLLTKSVKTGEVDTKKAITQLRRLVKAKKADDAKVAKAAARAAKEAEAFLEVKGGGTGVKNRAASTRHGLIVTLGRTHGYKPKIKSEVLGFWEQLGMTPERCLYCNEPNPSDMDHMISACNTTNKQYGLTNKLNLVYCCKACNSAKGGKSLDEWNRVGPSAGIDEASILRKKKHFNEVMPKIMSLVEKNKERLMMSDEHVEFATRCFDEINNFHAYMDWCVDTLTPPSSNVALARAEAAEAEASRLRDELDAARAEIAALKALA